MQNSRQAPSRVVRISEIVEDVVGCKWTLHVLEQVRRGVTRPGRLVRTAEGLTTKVLNERLAKLVRYGVLEKVSYREIPPRVEYRLTPLGMRLNDLLDGIAALQDDVDQGLVDGRACPAASESARQEDHRGGSSGPARG